MAKQDALCFSTAPAYPTNSGGFDRLSLSVRLVTPLFGGGPRAGYLDEITPFRPSSIRGQLRFWWRATRGAECNTSEELYDRESEIWGNTKRQSRVLIRVREDPQQPLRRVALDGFARDLAIRYALFPPFEAKQKDLTTPRVIESGGFLLEVLLRSGSDHLQEDVSAALWGWLNFGGLGARTRRGVGALYCRNFAGWDRDGRWMRKADGVRGWPTFSGGYAVFGPRPLPWRDCWRELLLLFKEFRQDRGPGGRGKTSWPEADEIRAYYNNRSLHAGEFPRSSLGMPIVFHFKDRHDPPDYTVNVADPGDPQKEGRLASPVILRPLAVSEKEAYPVVLVLRSQRPDRFYLWLKGKRVMELEESKIDAIERLRGRVVQRWQAQSGKPVGVLEL